MNEPTLEDLSDPVEPGPADWNDEGVVQLRGALDDDLMEAYESAWMDANGWRGAHAIGFPYPEAPDETGVWLCDAARPGGWDYCTPYVDVPELLDLACSRPIADALEEVVGEPCAVNLCLTGWTSTRRQWHQDGYLNRESVGDRYAAAWISLGQIVPAMGPFQYIPGSHRWHRLKMDKVLDALEEDGSDHTWPWRSEALLTPLVEEQIDCRGTKIVNHLPGRGDVLLWHPRLYHRGSEPAVQDAFRPALICHYSGVSTRPDMPEPLQRLMPDGTLGGWYFPIEGRLPVR